MKTVFEPEGCILVDCPKCGEWLDADADECKCGWSREPEWDDMETSDDEEEVWEDVPEP